MKVKAVNLVWENQATEDRQTVNFGVGDGQMLINNRLGRWKLVEIDVPATSIVIPKG